VGEVSLNQNPFLERIFSSRVRIQLLSHFLMHPDAREHIRALASRVDAQYNAVWKELRNLENAGLLQSESIGGRKVYTLNPHASMAAGRFTPLILMLQSSPNSVLSF